MKGDEYGKELEDALTRDIEEKVVAFDNATDLCFKSESHDTHKMMTQLRDMTLYKDAEERKRVTSAISLDQLRQVLQESLEACKHMCSFPTHEPISKCHLRFETNASQPGDLSGPDSASHLAPTSQSTSTTYGTQSTACSKWFQS